MNNCMYCDKEAVDFGSYDITATCDSYDCITKADKMSKDHQAYLDAEFRRINE